MFVISGREKDTTDEELCRRVQAGDRASASILVLRYKPQVSLLVKEAKPPARIEFDDLMQLGFIAVAKAAENWTPTRGAQFRTIAYRYAYNAINQGLEKMRRQLR